MAYGLKLKIEYLDRNEILTTINVYGKDYAGAVRERFAHASFEAEWGDSGSQNTVPTIYGSSVTVYLDAEEDFEYLDLFSSDSKKHLVEILKAGVVFGKWFIEPDTWSEPLIATPYPCNFTAYDGLGYLKDIAYEPNERQTVGAIILEILNKTGLGLPVNYNIDFVEAGGDAYTALSIDTNIYADKSCYDVLEELLKGCRVYQRGGEWWIETHRQLAAKAVTYPTYWREDEAQLDILPAIKQLTLKQDFGYQKNVLQNGSFEVYNKQLATFEKWDNITITPQQRDLNKDGDKFIFIPGQQYPDIYKNEGYGLITNGVYQKLGVKQTNSKVSFALKYAMMGNSGACLMFIGVKLIGDNATYYLRRTPFVQKDQEFEWININCKPSQGDDHITLKSHTEKTKQLTYQPPCSGTLQGIAGYYYNTFDPVTAYPFDKIVDHFESFRAVVSGFPVNGELQIYLYVPYTNRAEHQGSCYTGVTLELLDENEEEYPTDQTFVIVNNVNNNTVPSDIELKEGDYPDIVNNKLIYIGGFRRINDDPTASWSYPGSAIAYSYAEFLGRSLAAMMAVPRQKYQARLSDVIPFELVVIEDPENPGKKFIENGMVYSDDAETCEGQYAELIDFDIDSFAVENTTSTILPEPAKLDNPVARVENIDQRVELIDANGAKVSAPGFLYDNDFEFKKEDPEDLLRDGKTRIQIKKEGITPYNLSHDASTVQFSVTSVLKVNKDGNPNKILLSAGKFLSHNFYALDKDDRLAAL